MKIVITSDIHWHNFKEFDKLNEDGNSCRLLLYQKSMLFVRDYCNQNNIKHWIDAGDIFHSRDSINTEVLDLLGKTLDQIQGINLYFLKGNHDTGNRRGSVSTLNILSKHGKVINDNHIEEIKLTCAISLSIGYSIFIHFIPWDENSLLVDLINNGPKSDIVIAHRMIDKTKWRGALLSGESIDKLDMSKFDYAFIGHVHEKQQINEKMMYIGNLVSSGFGDTHRGSFLVYDTQEKKIEVIENPHSPLFIKKEIRKIEDLVDYKINAFYEFKIISNDTAEIEKIINKILTWKDKLAGMRVSVIKQLVAENRIDTTQSLTPENLLDQYIALNKLDEVQSKIGKEILEVSKNV